MKDIWSDRRRVRAERSLRRSPSSPRSCNRCTWCFCCRRFSRTHKACGVGDWRSEGGRQFPLEAICRALRTAEMERFAGKNRLARRRRLGQPILVEAKPLGFTGRRKLFPNDKNEAIAATAVRLSAIGPVMIFTAKAVSVPTLARAVLLALGETPADHPWPEHEWRVFEAVCREELDPDALELRAAQAGVVCHSNRLTPQVRLALEHLMRSKPPKIIIATTTLAQGVNVGISSVIVSTPYIGENTTIDKRDFWNICGRSGRAFVDGEGKILYAIDDTREPWNPEGRGARAWLLRCWRRRPG